MSIKHPVQETLLADAEYAEFWENLGTSGKSSSTGTNLTHYTSTPAKRVPRCYESHKSFKLGNGVVHGGSCSDPQDEFDIYVGLDDYMYEGFRNPYPWEKKDNGYVVIHFPIKDMGVPKDTKNFKAMIKWLCNQLQEGKSVHVGCIGGHGRTGMVLSALVHQVKGIQDSTTWVRKRYCKSVVETTEQVNYLHKHFGIKKTEPSKLPYTVGAYGMGGYVPSTTKSGTVVGPLKPLAKTNVTPMKSTKSIWG